MIQIIPAIDIIGGRCVRLSKGDYASVKVYDASPVDMAKAYADAGVMRLHIVDLDGAKVSDTVNIRVLDEIAASVDLSIEWGGGISDDASLARVFNAGASHAVIGSVAALHPERFESWLSFFGAERMVLGADVRDGKVAVRGWLEDTSLTIDALVDRFSPHGLSQAIVTDIGRDGMLNGPSAGLYVDLQERWPSVDFTVSGGISCMDDIRALDAAGLRKVIVGKAIYEGRISLSDIERWSLISNTK